MVEIGAEIYNLQPHKEVVNVTKNVISTLQMKCSDRQHFTSARVFDVGIGEVWTEFLIIACPRTY